MTILLLSYLYLIFILYGSSILLNKKPLDKNFCKNCDRCSFGYTGSGVLLLYKNNKKFLLGIDNKNELTDFGGRINYINEKTWNTSSRVLLKESNGIFNISGQEILSCDHIDIDTNIHKYRCYILPIKKYDKKLYLYNKIKSEYSTNSFKEIIDIIEINHESLKKLLYYKVDSPEIIPYEISPRLKKILNVYFESIKD